MPTEKQHREFLLGMSDPDTEHDIEVGLLDGTLDVDDLSCVEDELVDDYVFGQLSGQEEAYFLRHFLCTKDRKDKVAFSRSIHKFASSKNRRALPRNLPLAWSFLWPWRIPLSIAVAGMFYSVIWLGIRDVRLGRELAQARIAENERDRLQLELTEERNRSSLSSTPVPKVPSTETSSGSHLPNAHRPSDMTLWPGLARGIERITMIHIPSRENMVWITLQVPADPGGAFREELLGSNDKPIWSQEFSSPHSLLDHHEMTLGIPAPLLQPGDYRIKLEEQTGAGAFAVSETYSFRVSN